jgi:hypothetical protein
VAFLVAPDPAMLISTETGERAQAPCHGRMVAFRLEMALAKDAGAA